MRRLQSQSAPMNFDAFQQSIVSPTLAALAAHWDSVRGQRAMPAWHQLQPSRIATVLPIIWVYKYDRVTEQFTGRLAGDRIARNFGKNFRGIGLEEVHPPASLPYVYAGMMRGVMEPSLYHSRGRLFRQRERVVRGERIFLPLSEDGIHSDGLIGASDYQHPVLDPHYGPVEILGEGERWFPLETDTVAA